MARMMFLVDSSIFRRVEIQQLMNLTARALGEKGRRVWTLPSSKALKVYAEYTSSRLSGDCDRELLERMNVEAYKVGARLRKLFSLKEKAETERFVFALYRNIGITMSGRIPGQICVARCFFSRFYTPATCLAASALDDGIIRGLAGYGRLSFSQRLTEGCDRCIARFA